MLVPEAPGCGWGRHSRDKKDRYEIAHRPPFAADFYWWRRRVARQTSAFGVRPLFQILFLGEPSAAWVEDLGENHRFHQRKGFPCLPFQSGRSFAPRPL